MKSKVKQRKRVLLVEHESGRTDGFLNFVHEHQLKVELDTWRPYLRNPLPNLDFDGLILGGGPMMVRDLKKRKGRFAFYQSELDLIEQLARRNCPILGICLGSQILCDFFGGRVVSGKQAVGWYPVTVHENVSDPLFNSPKLSFPTFHYHRDHLIQLPQGAVPLASSRVSKYEAYRLDRERRIWGCLFHPEMEVRQVQSVFDQNPGLFTRHEICRSDLAPFDDGRLNRHSILRNFFEIVTSDIHRRN